MMPQPIGGGAIPPWTNLPAMGALSDPGAFAAGSTYADGLATFVMAGDTTIYDGYRENCPRFTIPLLTLYPDFNPETDQFEAAAVVTGIPFAGTTGYGLFLGFADRTTLATMNATAASLQDGSGANTNIGAIPGGASLAATGTTGTPPNAFMLRSFTGSSSTNVNVHGQLWWRIAASGLWIASGLTGGNQPTMALPLSNWQVQVGVMHRSAVSATPTMTARVYTRRLRGAAFAKLV